MGNRKTVPLDLPPKLSAEVDFAASELEWPKAQTMRIAMQAGLAMLRKIDYDIGDAIRAAAAAKEEEGRDMAG